MKKYILKDDSGTGKITLTDDIFTLSYREDGKGTAIADNGNGWDIKDTCSGTKKFISYSDVADIVVAFTLWQKHGKNLFSGEIFQGTSIKIGGK